MYKYERYDISLSGDLSHLIESGKFENSANQVGKCAILKNKNYWFGKKEINPEECLSEFYWAKSQNTIYISPKKKRRNWKDKLELGMIVKLIKEIDDKGTIGRLI